MNKNKLTFLAIFIIILMFLLALISINTVNLSQSKPSFPSRLTNLTLINTTEGNKALSEISQMHGGSVTLTDAYIISYANGNNWARVWISVSKSEQEAEDSKQRMSEKLQNNYMFAPPELTKVSDTEVFKTTDGQNNTHYFYSSGPSVIWIGTNLNPSKAKLLLKESIYKFKLSL